MQNIAGQARSKFQKYKECGTMVYSDARKALILARNLRSLMNVEFKNHDVTITATGVLDGVGNVIQLSNIDQGDTTVSRDGSNVKITSIYCKLLFRINASGSNTNIRVMLVLDKQTNQAIFATADLLFSVANVQSLVSPNNLDNQFRFRVLYDKIHLITAGGKESAFVKIYKKVNLRLRYDNTGNGIADLRSNSLALVVISNEATNTPTITGAVRLRFVDN